MAMMRGRRLRRRRRERKSVDGIKMKEEEVGERKDEWKNVKSERYWRREEGKQQQQEEEERKGKRYRGGGRREMKIRLENCEECEKEVLEKRRKMEKEEISEGKKKRGA